MKWNQISPARYPFFSRYYPVPGRISHAPFFLALSSNCPLEFSWDTTDSCCPLHRAVLPTCGAQTREHQWYCIGGRLSLASLNAGIPAWQNKAHRSKVVHSLACSYIHRSGIKHGILGLCILVNFPLHVLHYKLDEELVDCVFGLDLHRHCDEEGDKEEHTTGQGDHLLGRQVHFIPGKFGNLSFVREETHHSGYGTTYHDHQVDDEDEVKNFVLFWNTRQPPVMKLKWEKENNRQFLVIQYCAKWDFAITGELAYDGPLYAGLLAMTEICLVPVPCISSMCQMHMTDQFSWSHWVCHMQVCL